MRELFLKIERCYKVSNNKNEANALQNIYVNIKDKTKTRIKYHETDFEALK